MNFQMFNLDLEKAEEPEITLPTSVGSSKKRQSSRKISTSVFLTMPKDEYPGLISFRMDWLDLLAV